MQSVIIFLTCSRDEDVRHHVVVLKVVSVFVCLFWFWVGIVSAENQPITASDLDQTTAQPVFLDGIAAIVNGEIITISELYRNVAWKKAVQFSAGPKDNGLSLIIDSLFEAIDQVLLLQEINQTQFLSVPKNVIDQTFKDYVDLFGSRQALEQVLEQSGFTMEEFYIYLWREATITRYGQQKFETRIQLRESEVIEYMQKNYQKYNIAVERLGELDHDDFAEMRIQAKKEMYQQQLKDMFQARMSDLRDKAEIKILYPDPELIPGDGLDQEEQSYKRTDDTAITGQSAEQVKANQEDNPHD